MASTTTPTRRRVERASPPTWVKPQLASLVKTAPDGPDWLHEIKLDGYRMHARLDAGRVQILTRRGNDWTEKYPAITKAIAGLSAQNAYLDGELCGVLPDGRTAFNLIQNASDTGEGILVFFLFDLLFLDGEDLSALPLVDRKVRLEAILTGAPDCPHRCTGIAETELGASGCRVGRDDTTTTRTDQASDWPTCHTPCAGRVEARQTAATASGVTTDRPTVHDAPGASVSDQIVGGWYGSPVVFSSNRPIRA